MKLNQLTPAIFLIAILLTTSLNAQVTIGSGQPPATGALLDLKEEGTTTKGMMLPRVKLDDVDKLKMGTNEILDADNGGDQYKKHTGLWVYNISGNPFPKCAPIPDGLYVWDGAKWTGINTPTPIPPATLDVGSKLNFDLPSGRDLRPLAAHTFTATWSPANPLAYTRTAVTGGSLQPGGVAFTAGNITASPLATSPTTFSMTPDVMTIVNVNLPWQSKESTLTFDVAANECYPAQSKTITLNQTNYGLTVDGKVVPDQVDITASGARTANIASNAQWKLSSIAPTVNPAVTSTELGVTKGADLTNGTAETNTASYNVTVGAAKSRYNYLTFSDNESPKRFSDVVLTVAQCTGTSDLTMAQYKDLWEEMYGLTPGVDEPDSNGNTAKNTNQVQWHYDQNNNIFFSSVFGTERWMITNLAANSYATASPNKPPLTQTYASNPSPYTAAYYGYPNVATTTNAGLATQYNARERLGRLYNFAAATGNQNPSTGNQTNTVHGPHQGICPNTWHLPSDLEWTNLMTDLTTSPTKYSGNTTGTNTAVTIKDMCEPTANTGKSFGILDGGFNSLLAGYAAGGSANNFGADGSFWSASSANADYAWYRNLYTGGGAVNQAFAVRFYFFSVRCKK